MPVIVVKPSKITNIVVNDVITGSSAIVSKQTVKTANINLKSVNNVLLPNKTGDVTLSTIVTGSRLDSLDDVQEINPPNNSTLVYNSATDKYIVKELDIDGGAF